MVGTGTAPTPEAWGMLVWKGLEWGRSPVRVTILGWAAECCIPCPTLNAADFYIVVSPMTDFNIPGESLNFTGKASVTISNSSLGEVGWGRSGATKGQDQSTTHPMQSSCSARQASTRDAHQDPGLLCQDQCLFTPR